MSILPHDVRGFTISEDGDVASGFHPVHEVTFVSGKRLKIEEISGLTQVDAPFRVTAILDGRTIPVYVERSAADNSLSQVPLPQQDHLAILAYVNTVKLILDAQRGHDLITQLRAAGQMPTISHPSVEEVAPATGHEYHAPAAPYL